MKYLILMALAVTAYALDDPTHKIQKIPGLSINSIEYHKKSENDVNTQWGLTYKCTWQKSTFAISCTEYIAPPFSGGHVLDMWIDKVGKKDDNYVYKQVGGKYQGGEYKGVIQIDEKHAVAGTVNIVGFLRYAENRFLSVSALETEEKDIHALIIWFNEIDLVNYSIDYAKQLK